VRVGIIGCGAIGTTLAKYLEEEPNVEHLLIADRTETCALKLASRLTKAGSTDSVERMIQEVDVVIEAASQAAVVQFGPEVLKAGRDLIILSAGALLDPGLLEAMDQAAAAGNSRYHVPSGALAGMDGLKGALAGQLESVTLITSKPPVSLADVDYIKDELGLDKAALAALDKPLVLFEGPASRAVKKFPKNVNVAATLSLAGLGPKKTMVKVVADPTIERNTHTVIATGDFGRMEVTVANVPSLRNPRTSHLAALSAIAALKNLWGPRRVGT